MKCQSSYRKKRKSCCVCEAEAPRTSRGPGGGLVCDCGWAGGSGACTGQRGLPALPPCSANSAPTAASARPLRAGTAGQQQQTGKKYCSVKMKYHKTSLLPVDKHRLLIRKNTKNIYNSLVRFSVFIALEIILVYALANIHHVKSLIKQMEYSTSQFSRRTYHYLSEVPQGRAGHLIITGKLLKTHVDPSSLVRTWEIHPLLNL